MFDSSSRNGLYSQNNAAVASPRVNDLLYDWEIPEISLHNANALGSAFLEKKPMTTETIHSLFIKYAGSSLLVDKKDPEIRDLLLDLLQSGAERGSQPLRALIYIVYEFFQKLPRADLYDSKLLWMSEAVASGAFFLRKTLQHLDSSLCEKAIQAFQDHGGYNRFYATFIGEAVSKILMQTSLEDVIPLSRKLSSYTRGDRPLHILSSATTYRGLEKIVKLMDPQEVNKLNDCGETALYRACMAGATANVLILLSHGADASIAASPGGPTCLHWLFHFNPRDVNVIARELVKHGAPIHSQSKWKIPLLHYPFTLPVGTPLHWAVENSAAEATRALLCQGADPSVRDGCDPYAYDDNVRDLDMSLPPDCIPCSVADHTTLGFNAVDVAVKNRDHEILAILLSHDTSFDPDDTDEEGYSAVHRLDAGEWQYTIQGSAVWCRLFQGSTSSQATSLKKTIAILLQHGFKLDRLTNQRKLDAGLWRLAGQTALMIAVAKGSIETVKQLLHAGADVNLANGCGETALLSFAGRWYSHDKERQSQVVSLLLDANANLHVRGFRNITPFLNAALQRFLEVATALLNRGADLRDRITYTCTSSDFGKTAFALLTVHNGKEPAIVDEWLVTQLNKHILPRIAASEGSALHKELLERADPNGSTLLHYAAANGLVRSCAVLLEAKININSICRIRQYDRNIYRTALDETLKHLARDRLGQGTVEPMNEQGMLYCFETIKWAEPLPPFPPLWLLSCEFCFLAWKRLTEGLSVTERVVFEEALRDVAKLLRNKGGEEANHLIEKQFNIPLEQDLRGLREVPKLTNEGA